MVDPGTPGVGGHRSLRLLWAVVALVVVGTVLALDGPGSGSTAPPGSAPSGTQGTVDHTTTTATSAPKVSPLARDASLWLTADELEKLPTSGPAWDSMVAFAEEDWGPIDIDDNNGVHDVHTLAGALVAARTSDQAMTARVREALRLVPNAHIGGLLPLARNLSGYVIAADVLGYHDPAFDEWLTSLLDRDIEGRAGIRSLRESAMADPSNHGTHARASVLAIGLYLHDDALVSTMAERFHDWLGRSSEGFVWKERYWQADPGAPVGINRAGAEIDGFDVDGVLPEEQRRSGGFTVDPPKEGYVWEALQGVTVTADLLDRAGYSAWEWEDQAILRAFRWLYDVDDFPAEGDDTWQPWVVNAAYGTNFPAATPTLPGKNMGFTDWNRPST